MKCAHREGDEEKSTMRVTVVVLILLLSACSSQIVRCERHLTPINPPRKLLSDAAAGPTRGMAPALAPALVALKGTSTRQSEVRHASSKSQVSPPGRGGKTP